MSNGMIDLSMVSQDTRDKLVRDRVRQAQASAPQASSAPSSSEMIDRQTSFAELLRKPLTKEMGGNKARTYVGDKGRDDEVTSVLKWVNVNSKAELERALKVGRANMFGSPDPTDKTPGDQMLCGKNVTAYLEKHFEGWNWVVRIQYGVLTFFCQQISLVRGVNWSFAWGHPHYRWIFKEAGRYLERYNAPRKVRDLPQFVHDAKYEHGLGGLHMSFET